MSGRDSSPKISLALLKGRPAAQSVPSISFRVNPCSDNLSQVSDAEDVDEEDPSIEISIGSSLEVSSPGQVIRAESLREASPVKEHGGRSFGKRSSSLDSSCGSLSEPTSNTGSTTSSKTPESSSLLSRITKTFEDKINEIRNDKKEKDARSDKDKDKDRLGISGESTESDGGSFSEDRSPSKERKFIDIVQKTVEADKGLKADITGSPPKTKSSIVQDISEHTSKFKSELGNIRPKISELRQRRSINKENAKNNKESTKAKPFVFTSLLVRDEGMDEEMLLECDESEVDKAVEAHEDPCIFSENMAEVDGDVSVSEKGTEQVTGVEKPRFPKPSPKKRLPPLIPNRLTELTMKEQCLNMVNALPLSMGLLTKVSIGLFIICFILPLPRFLAGLVLGVNVAGIVFYCLLHFLIPAPPVLPAVDDGPVMLALPTYEDKQLHKGWMNELQGEYTPDSYHVSLTHSVMVRLQGSRMQIDNLRGKVPKHARLKEEVRNLAFTHHREYEIAGCDVMLLPRNLPRRWLWSRKYPICIRLAGGSRGSTPSPVSIASTPTGSANGSPTHLPVAGLGRQGSSESEVNWSLDNNKSSGEDDLLTSSLDMASFEEVTQDMCQEKSLYLFARTDREKDDWFRRLAAASELAVKPQSSPSHKPMPPEEGDTILLEGIGDSFSDNSKDSLLQDLLSTTPPDLSFERYMARLLYQPGGMISDGTPGPANVAWINAMAGRLCYDFLRNPHWANKVQERVQRKLSKLHVPYFVGEVVVCGVNMGSHIPQLKAVGTPQVDPRGLWVDLNVEYSGNFTMSLETKLDLMKLKRTDGISGSTPNTSSPPSPAEPNPHSVPRVYTRSSSSDGLLRNLHFETDTDDSVESSSEEECDEEGIVAEAGLPVGGSGPTSRRLLRLVDSVAASRYFQQAAESSLLQRALQGVSNTRIELSVEVRRLAGTLALNVPPPPADRLWYGFRGVPELVMVARPRVGDRTVNLPILVEFIQKQLRLIFEKVFVLPNMDDIVIPIMSPLLPGQHMQPRPPWEHSHRSMTESPVTITPCPSSTLSTPSVKFTPSPH